MERAEGYVEKRGKGKMVNKEEYLDRSIDTLITNTVELGITLGFTEEQVRLKIQEKAV